ncbi:hypothetical protein OG604_01040 [Streptomyces sp. NBC_01231]|nr:hypothetical protein OG604_01040 [Streptomyces sp. NBC_01231]
MDRHAHTTPRPDTFATGCESPTPCSWPETRARRPTAARGRGPAPPGSGPLADRPRSALLRAEALLCLGELAAAEQEAEAAVRAAVPGALLGRWPAAVLAEVLTELGRHEEAEGQLRRATPGPFTRTADLPRYLRARGRHRLAVRRPAAALDDFLRSGELTYRQGAGSFARMPWELVRGERWKRRWTKIARAGDWPHDRIGCQG